MRGEAEKKPRRWVLPLAFLVFIVAARYVEHDDEPWLIISVPDEVVGKEEWKLVVCEKKYDIATPLTVFTNECEGTAYLLNEESGVQSNGGYVTYGMSDHISVSFKEDRSFDSVWEKFTTYP